MCNYIKENNICSITLQNCPFMYFCNKESKWKPLKNMPANCKVKENIEIPKGYYKVRMVRKGYLYVDINDQTYKFKNLFEEVPLYVKVTKTRQGEYRLKK